MAAIFKLIPVYSINIIGSITAFIFVAGCSNMQQEQINYLDQRIPGLKAEIFAPGIISTDSFEHSAPAFSPDGTVVLWTVVNSFYRGFTMEMKFENGRWSKPAQPSFADSAADDYYPSFSPDGKKLYFSSRRPLPKGFPPVGDMRIWEVERSASGWGIPRPIDTAVSEGNEYAHSIASSGTLYFTSSAGADTKWNIKKASKHNGDYDTTEQLPFNINSTDYEDGPYISPSEDFLIFESIRPESIEGNLDLYISFRDKNGKWSLPVNMGSEINSAGAERFARLSPDGKYLFFGSNRNMSETHRGFDIFWIDAGIIDTIRQQQNAKKQIDDKLGSELIQSLYSGGNPSTEPLLVKWLQAYPNNLDALIAYCAILRKNKKISQLDSMLYKNDSMWGRNETFIMEKSLLKFWTNGNKEAVAFLEPVLKQDGRLRDKYIYLSNALFEMQLFEPSRDFFEKGMAINPWHRGYFQRACAYARIGDKDNAFKNLERAIALGFTFKHEFESNADLQLLRQDSRWQALMQKVQ